MSSISHSPKRRFAVAAEKKEDQATILEIYRIFVTTVTAAENRRQQTSTVYLGMIVALTTVTSAFQDIRFYSVVGVILISIFWLLSISYFRRLAKAKFHVIKILEAKLPFAAFDTENAFRTEGTKGKQRRRTELTHLEMAIPILVVIVCVMLLLLNPRP